MINNNAMMKIINDGGDEAADVVESRCHDWPFELSFVHCQLPSPTTWASTTVTLCSYDLTSCVVDITNYDQQTRWSQSSSSWSPRASSRFVGISEWMTMIRYSGFPKQVYILSELSPIQPFCRWKMHFRKKNLIYMTSTNI